VFYADIPNTARSARAVTDEKTLTGKIEDGDIIFNLKGTYFPETGDFVLSAGSSILVYQIEGTVKDDKLKQAAATVKVLAGGNWVTHTVSVNAVTNADDVNITGSTSNQQQPGIPQNWLGKWILAMPYWDEDNDSDDPSGYEDMDMIISPFGITIIGEFPVPLDVLEVTMKGTTTAECVAFGTIGGWSCMDEGDKCNPINQGDCTDCSCIDNEGFCECGASVDYMKISLKESGDKLVFTLYFGSIIDKNEANALATVKSFDTATQASSDDPVFEMHR
jgi:hypothetical protein